jgi:transcription initiation factor IIF auxiliary subunit
MRAKVLFALGALLVAGIASAQSGITVGNTSKPAGDGRWNWTVYITAPPTVLSQIRCVEYTLHPSFPNPIRRVCAQGKDPRHAFPLSTNGWGEFTIKVRVFFAKGNPQVIDYPLKL